MPTLLVACTGLVGGDMRGGARLGLGALWAVFGLAALGLPAAGLAAAPHPLDAPPLTADPAELLLYADSKPRPEGHDAEILLLEEHVAFDAQGRRTSTTRVIYRTFTPEAARQFGVARAQWSPWLEARPVLEARSIGRDAQVQVLDPKTVSEAAESEGARAPLTFGDDRVVRAPVPGSEPGAVVEEVITRRDERPYFDGGGTWGLTVNPAVPVRRVRFVLDAPRALGLRWELQGSPAPLKRTESGGRVRVQLTLDEVAPRDRWEPWAPHDYVAVPTLRFSTGKSWKDVAAAYGRVLERQAATGDLAPLTGQIVGSATDRDEVAARLLAWLRREIRYTGLHFGRAGIVPYTPDQVLERKYGDCKDMALLLVSLLARAGVTAQVALLSTDWADPHPALPGLGAFDHAIVYVPGKRPLWMDPTDGTATLGTLPISDQGRLALVIAPGTSALVRTPAPSAAESRFTLLREVTLAEEGLGRIAETREAAGTPASLLRASHADREGVDARLDAYAKAAFGMEAPTARKASGLSAVTGPVTLRVEGPSPRAQTVGPTASVGVASSSLLMLLPQLVLRGRAAGEDDEEEPQGAEPAPKRTVPLVLPFAYSGELEYRITPPPGFVARPLPADEKRSFGPATLGQRWSLQPDGSVRVRFSFDTGPGVFTPVQADALLAAIPELAQGRYQQVEFDSQAGTLAGDGRYREAIAAYRALSAAHPTEALHQEQLSSALLEAGLGDLARAHARRAVALEPRRAQAHHVLAQALQHDAFGRRFALGFDHAGAVAALRQAKELAPKDFRIRAELAWLLEHDDQGLQLTPRAPLSEAADEYRGLRPLGPDNDDRLLICLHRLGRLKELREAAREAKATEVRNGMLVAATTALDGAPAGLTEAGRLGAGAEAKQKVVAAATDWLVQLRRYREAAELLRQSGGKAQRAAEAQGRLALLERVQPFEASKLGEKDPVDLVRRFLAAALFSEDALKSFAPRFSKRTPVTDLEATQREVRRSARQLRATGMPLAVSADLFFALAEPKVEGDEATGWRVRLQNSFGGSTTPVDAYVLREDGALRMANASTPAELAGLALVLAREGREASARRFLSWAGAPPPDPVCPGEKPLQTVLRDAALRVGNWVEGLDPTAELVAALACAGEAARPRVAATLSWTHLRRGRSEQALAVAQAHPLPDGGFVIRSLALKELGRDAEQQALLAARLAELPDDEQALSAEFDRAQTKEDFEAMERWGRRMLALGKGGAASVYNQLAWATLFRPGTGPVTEAALEDGRRAVALSGERSHASLHTLATLYAESGQPAEAMQTLRKALDVSQGQASPDDWYVAARVAEECGFPDWARGAYQRLAAPKGRALFPTFTLAQRRLAGLPPPAP